MRTPPTAHTAQVLLAVAALAMVLTPTAGAQTVRVFAEESLRGTFNTALVDVPDDNRLIALDRAGLIRVVRKAQPGPLAAPALDFSALVNQTGENGAVGLAIHPNFASNGYIYIFHSRNGAGPQLVRYTLAPGSLGPIDPGTRTVILTFPAYSFIHLSGWIGFGPDGYLYITHGDNGAEGFAQDTTQIRGKILRINVNADDFPTDPDRNYAIPPNNPLVGGAPLDAKEVWCIGVRNAYRCSFDQLTGDFYLGDVGDSSREEVDRLPATAWQGNTGVNFGWPCFEGNLPRSTIFTCVYTQFPYAAPLVDYTRADLSCVIGGVVYRGCAAPALAGRYLFSNCITSNELLSINPASPGTLTRHPIATAIGQVLGYAQNAQGEVYLLAGSGVFKLAGLGSQQPSDCNANNIPDQCELAAGTATDLNNNGVLDVCEQLCPADVNGDGAVSVQDVFDFLTIWFGNIPAADFNRSGAVSVQDIFDFLTAWFAGCV